MQVAGQTVCWPAIAVMWLYPTEGASRLLAAACFPLEQFPPPRINASLSFVEDFTHGVRSPCA